MDFKAFVIQEARDPLVITDFGVATDVEHQGKVITTIPRYGVWTVASNELQRVIDTGDDLEALKVKHGITSDPIKLGKR